MQEAKPVNVVEFLTRASLLLGLMSTFCYAFGVGYVFHIEPRFLPAFSLSDLVFLFASSTSYLIFLVITLVPGLGLLAAGRQARVLISGSEPESPTPRGRKEGERPLVKAERALPLIAATIAVSITLVFVFLDVQDLLDDIPFVILTLPDFMVAAGVAISLASLSSNRYWRALAPIILFVYVLAAFYVFGAMLGYRDLLDTAEDRKLPCAFIDSRPECFDLLAIGSDVALVRSRGRAVMLPRDRIRSVQPRRPIGR